MGPLRGERARYVREPLVPELVPADVESPEDGVEDVLAGLRLPPRRERVAQQPRTLRTDVVVEHGYGRHSAAKHPPALGPDARREHPRERRRARGPDVAKIQVELLHSRVAHPRAVRPSRRGRRRSRRSHPLVLVEFTVAQHVRRVVRAVGDPPRRQSLEERDGALVSYGVKLQIQRSKHAVEHPRPVRVPPPVQRGRQKLGTLGPDGRVGQVQAGDARVEVPVSHRVEHRDEHLGEPLLEVGRAPANHLRRRRIPVAVVSRALGPRAPRGWWGAGPHRAALHRLPLPPEHLHGFALALASRLSPASSLLLRVPLPRQLDVRRSIVIHGCGVHALPRRRFLLGAYDDRGARVNNG
mmetsp:Transcript_3953/g.17453  ORF Transcript_3953/g.17453 Transcript_3953/m.17453 type:complete len:355 (+) Transcript_3953:738-1802(+)